jgi:serine O-acetyltransferase
MNIAENNLKIITDNLFNKYYFCQAPENNFDSCEIIKSFLFDYNRYFDGNYIDSDKFFSRIELIAILCYRIAHWFFENENETTANHYSNLGRLISGFEIYYSAQIGKGMKINHGLGTVIGSRCKIGDNVLLHQNVTIGDRKGERPTILDNVTIYAGAKILGGIRLGNNSIVGANAVCLIDVPDKAVAVGVPAQIISK